MTSPSYNTEKVALEHLALIADAIRDTCFSTAATAYEDARIAGLCHDGAWECALEALQAVDMSVVVASVLDKR